MTAMSVMARNLSLRAHFGADRHPTLAPATLYFALFRGDPFGAGVEPSSVGGYARVAKANDATLWGTIAVGDTLVTNAASVIAWPAATGVYSGTGPLDYWAVFDNSSGGNLLYAGPLSTGITVTGAGDVPRLPISALTISQAG